MRLPRIAAASLLLLVVACNRNKAPDGSAGAPGADPAAAANPGASPLAFLKGFEGQIDLVIKESAPGSTPTPLTVLVKGDKVRADVPEKLAKSGGPFLGAKAYAILDAPAKKLSLVSDDRKQVVVIDLEKSGEQFKNMHPPRPMPGGGPAPAAPEGPPTKVTKTGKYETVAGQKCEDWDVTSDHREATVCIADQGASFFHIPLTGIPTEHLWMAELFDGKHFPLQAVSYEKDGQTEKSRIQVTRIDKTSPPASAFEYPADYRVMDLAQMMAGLMSFPPGAMPFGSAGGRFPGFPPGHPHGGPPPAGGGQ